MQKGNIAEVGGRQVAARFRGHCVVTAFWILAVLSFFWHLKKCSGCNFEAGLCRKCNLGRFGICWVGLLFRLKKESVYLKSVI